MTFYKTFYCSAYYPNEEMREWIIENDVTIHAVRDAGMYGNRNVFYSSPTLTNGQVRIGRGYDSSRGGGTTDFSANDYLASEELYS